MPIRRRSGPTAACIQRIGDALIVPDALGRIQLIKPVERQALLHVLTTETHMRAVA